MIMFINRVLKVGLSLSLGFSLFACGAEDFDGMMINETINPQVNVQNNSGATNFKILKPGKANPNLVSRIKRVKNNPNGIKALSSINGDSKDKVFAHSNFRFSTNQWHHRKLNSITAWEKTPGNKDAIVAVIDSGVDYN